MKTWRWIGLAAGGVTILALAFVAWVYGASEAHYRGFPTPPPFTHPIAEDAATIARGEHLAATRGCRGCHGADLEGEIMWGATVTPNLPAYAHEHGAAAVEAALRHGIGHNHRALYSMPAYNFMRMSDEDVAALIAYLRNAPVSEEAPQGGRAPWYERTFNDFMIRLAIARGEDGAIPEFLDQVPALTQQDNPDPRIARGEYLAMTSCNECHGFDLRSHAPWPETAPDLIVVGAYTPEQFTRLMREGVPSSGADLEMMGPVARGRFVHWTDQEVGDLYAFLSDMSRRAIEAESE
ncbi:MAG: c-type cytochrome [Hyphomonadaceae bacterium]